MLLLISLLQAINQFDPTIFHLFLYHDNIFENHKWIMIINKSCLYFRSHCSLIGVLSDFFVLWFLLTNLILVRFIPTIKDFIIFLQNFWRFYNSLENYNPFLKQNYWYDLKPDVWKVRPSIRRWIKFMISFMTNAWKVYPLVVHRYFKSIDFHFDLRLCIFLFKVYVL